MIFEEVSLQDCLEFVVDNRGKTVPIQDSGIPLIATNCISNDNLYPQYKNVRYVSDEIYDSWFRAHPQPEDIILTNKGSKNGAICLVPEPVSFCIAQDMVALRAKSDVVYSKYLFAALRSELVQNRIKDLNVDSVIPHFKKTDFNKLYFPLPPFLAQKRIGDCYFDFCKKIELNSQINKTLEEMAQAIFKSWFVDFDPVKAKMNGDQPEGMDAATASLFPEKLVESELGLIPEGWNLTSIGKISKCFDKVRIPLSKRQREQKQGDIPYHGATSVMDFVDEAIFNDIYLLIGEDGSVIKKDGTPFIQYIWGPAWVNNHAHVLQGTDSVSTEQLMLFFQQTHINAYITGAVQLKINQGNMNSIPFVKAPDAINENFNHVITPLYAKVRAIKEENEQLVKLRDTLLPKLLSGEIELGDTII